MIKKFEIQREYKRTYLGFSKKPTSFGSPQIPVLLKSPLTNKETLFTSDFIVDTGASISIINSRYESFIKELIEIDTLKVRYGGGTSKSLPIYKVIFIIHGYEISSSVAYDAKVPYLVLGHHDFLENFSYNIFESTPGRLRLIKR